MATNDFTTVQDEEQSFIPDDADGITDIPIYFVSNPVAVVAKLGIVLRHRTCTKCGDIHQNRHLCNDCFDDVNNPRRRSGLTRKQMRNPSLVAAWTMEQSS